MHKGWGVISMSQKFVSLSGQEKGDRMNTRGGTTCILLLDYKETQL